MATSGRKDRAGAAGHGRERIHGGGMARGISRPREKAAARRAGRRKAEMEIRGTEGQEAEVEAREMEMGAKEAATEIREAETETREAEVATEVREAATETREAEVATEVREAEAVAREAEAVAATEIREAEVATEIREAEAATREVATAVKEAETARWKAQGRRQGPLRRISFGGIRGRRMGVVRRVFPFRIFRSPFPGGDKGKMQENRGFYHLLLSAAVLYFL